MSGVAIYLEGGGPGPDTKEVLRRGMEAFLESLRVQVRAKGMYWKLVACGGRRQAFNAWSWPKPDARYPLRILLVDAEAPVSGGFADHLADRPRDQWPVSANDEDRIHLMVQVMETWIIADISTLACYYGPGFRGEALPTEKPLEEVRKKSIEAALRNATKNTQRGRYRKIRHASDLLARIDPGQVRQRCPACDRLFTVVGGLIRNA